MDVIMESSISLEVKEELEQTTKYAEDRCEKRLSEIKLEN